jgi:peroxiredoxin
MIRLVLALAVVCSVANAARADDDESSIGARIEDFTLRDGHGREHRLADYQGASLVVVAFLGVECPLANLYAPRLVELAKRYEPQKVQFLAINSNRQDSHSDLLAYVRAHGIGFPVLKDPGNVIADRFAAQRTPEVFVLDRDRAIRYRGRIDDQYSVGIQRAKATRHDLAAALDELLAGREVTNPVTTAPGCFIGRQTIGNPQTDGNGGAPTWSKEISRIFQRRCQECHRPGQLAPFPLLGYDDVIGWAETIREVVSQDRMPPWNANPAHGRFANDLRLTDEEKRQVIAWIDNGAAEGNSAELPPPREFVSGWRIPPPDQVVYMSNTSFRVPAEGVVDYQWFYVDPGFKQDRWVQAVEARPGCRGVVHHITVYYKPPGGQWDMRHNSRINLLGGFNPGGEPLVLPEGMAILLPAGTQLAFEMHYTPNGQPQADRSYLGLCFADPAAIRKQVHAYMPADTQLVIPPGEGDYRSEVSYRFAEPMDLLLMRPHMHLRGKSFRYIAHYPNGTSEILLDVPRFDFNWQHSYVLSEPKRMPAGTKLEMTAHFDNSPENPFNPDPTATVRWGDQSWDEMMIGIFCAVAAEEDLLRAPRTRPASGAAWALAAMGLVLGGLIVAGYWKQRRRRAA